MRIILFILLFNSSIGDTKSKLKIRKCHRANGSIDYQEKPCKDFKGISKNHFTKNKPAKKASKKPITNKKKTSSKHQNPAKLKYKKLSNLLHQNLETQIVTEQVKSDKISIQVMSRWSMIKKVFNDKLLHMRFLDETPASRLSLLIDFTDPQGKSFSTQELIGLSELIGSRYAKGSSEGQVDTKVLPIKLGKGVLATFTNSDLVDGFKYTTKGLIYKGKWLIQFTLLSDSLNGSGYNFALNSLSNSILIN